VGLLKQTQLYTQLYAHHTLGAESFERKKICEIFGINFCQWQDDTRFTWNKLWRRNKKFFTSFFFTK